MRAEDGARRSPRRAVVPSLAQDELIGLAVEVVASGDPGLRTLHGKVVDETMKTFTIRASPPTGSAPGGAPTPPRDLIVAKAGQAFAFTLPDGTSQRLQGEALAHRPEDRIRKAAQRSPRSTR